MQKLRQDKPGAPRPKPRKWFRPKSIKKMMVELERPFVWPEVPEKLDMYVLNLFYMTSGWIGIEIWRYVLLSLGQVG
jgi:hypothetical protein